MHPQRLFLPFQQHFVVNFRHLFRRMQQVNGHLQRRRAGRPTKQTHLPNGSGRVFRAAVADQPIQRIHQLRRRPPTIKDVCFDHVF